MIQYDRLDQTGQNLPRSPTLKIASGIPGRRIKALLHPRSIPIFPLAAELLLVAGNFASFIFRLDTGSIDHEDVFRPLDTKIHQDISDRRCRRCDSRYQRFPPLTVQEQLILVAIQECRKFLAFVVDLITGLTKKGVAFPDFDVDVDRMQGGWGLTLLQPPNDRRLCRNR